MDRFTRQDSTKAHDYRKMLLRQRSELDTKIRQAEEDCRIIDAAVLLQESRRAKPGPVPPDSQTVDQNPGEVGLPGFLNA